MKSLGSRGQRRGGEWACIGVCDLHDRADSFRYFLTTSRDMTARLYTLDPVEGFKPKSFAGHRDVVLGAWFSEDEKTVRDNVYANSHC